MSSHLCCPLRLVVGYLLEHGQPTRATPTESSFSLSLPEAPVLLHATMLADLILNRTFSGNHNYCEFMITVVLIHPEDTSLVSTPLLDGLWNPRERL